jgi:hypothetical protein
MMGSRPFPSEIPKDELARMSAIERRTREAKAGPIKIPPKPGTQSEVLRGEEAVRAAGVSPDPLARARSERMPSDIARGNRVGAVGDVEKVGGSGSPMMRGKAIEHADSYEPLKDEKAEAARLKARAEGGLTPGFASRLRSRTATAINDAPFEKGTAEQWKAALTKGVPASERDWVGMDDFIEQNKGKVLTREQVAEKFNEGRIQIGEVVHSDAPRMEFEAARKATLDKRYALERTLPPNFERRWQLVDALRYDPTSSLDEVLEQAGIARDEADILLKDKAFAEAVDAFRKADAQARRLEHAASGAVRGTRYAAYVEPGGENYREVVLTLPKKTRSRPDLQGGRWVVRDPDAPGLVTMHSDRAAAERNAAERTAATGREHTAQSDAELQAQLSDDGGFTSPHWPGVDNPIAHVRMNDRTLPNGEKAVFIEEIQSDWHQKGRREGYGEQPDSYDSLADPVPDAPFKKTPEWQALGLMRAVDEAVETGADRVVWTTGAQQARRYDLSKVADEVHYNPESGSLRVLKDGDTVHEGTYDAKALPDVIGKDASDKLLATKRVAADDPEIQGATVHTLAGLDLKVGGEGMITFYDKMLPNAVKDYAKKMGVKLEVEPVAVGIEKATLTPDDIAELAEKASARAEAEVGDLDGGAFHGKIANVLAEVQTGLADGVYPNWREAFLDITDGGDNSAAVLARASEMLRVAEKAKPAGVGAAQNLSFKITPELKAKIKANGQPLGFIGGELLGALGGAAIGGKGDEDDTAGERVVKALAGAALGVAGVKAAKALGKRVPKDAMNDLGTDARLVSGKPNRREKPGELFNKSVQRALDPAGYELWKNEELRAIKAGYKRTKVTDASLREAAKIADVDAISLKDVGDLKDSELIATANRIKQDRAEYASLIERMEKGETSKEAWGELQQDMEDVLKRLVVSDTRLNQAGSETGRRLRVFKMIMGDAAKAGKPDAVFKTARQVLGVKELGDDVLDALTGIMKKPGLSPKQRELELAHAISGFLDKGPIEAMLDIRRWGMLTAPATHAVNLTGNVTELAADKMIVTPIAAAIDRVVSKLSPNGQRSITGTGRYSGYGKGFTDELKKIKSNFKSYFQGVDPEEPLAALRMQRANYVKSFGLDKEGAWRAALKPGAQVLQKAGDIVYGMMHVTDRPFMEAALQSSLAERSALRAAREGVKPGTDAFKKRVAELMKPENVSEVDATMAVMESMDATFKTPTGLTAATHMLTNSEHGMARALGYGLKWAAPFTNTPANLIKKGLEATPGVGQVLTEIQARGLKKRLQKMGASKEEIGREVQRKRVTGAAKQIGTGAGLVGLGYLWTKLGMLRGEYVEPRAQTEAERDESGVARLTGQGPLTLKIGDTAHSLSGFSQFAPLLALGHALAQSDMEQAADPSNQVSLGKRAWDIGAATAKSTLRTVKEMPMLQGMKNLSEIGDGVGKTVGREAASMVPFSSGIAAAARVMDPEEAREVKTFGDAVKERLPGARETLPSKVTLMGKVRGNAGPIEELISPTRPQRVIDGPVEKELIRLKVTPGMPRELPGEGRKAYVERVKIEGTELDQVLSRVIASPDYGQWPPPEWVQRAVENSPIWTDQTDKRPPQDKAKDALLRYMIRFVRTEQGKRRKEATP